MSTRARVLFASLVLAAACGDPLTASAPDGGTPDGGTPPPDGGPACAPGSLALTENRAVYDTDGLDVIEIDLHVDDLAALADVDNDVPGAQVATLFQAPGFSAPNATLEVRGRSTRFTVQKSYKIKLEGASGLWRGARTINLNKHPFDLTRVRQQLSFELLRSIPDLTSLRTHFIHLVINGEDRGLYTQVENPDGYFLTSHGLDPAGSIYKPVNFYFQTIDDATAADPAKLALIVETKSNADLPRLRQMLVDVNDPALDINEVVAKYFDRDNYLAWMALTLLTGDWDTRAANFMLYSPPGCGVWYFLPWDYDGSLGWNEQPGNTPRPRWHAGLANFWGLPLHQRVFTDPNNVSDLRAEMARLTSTVLSSANVAAKLSSYRDVVAPYVSIQPDLWYLPAVIDGSSWVTQWNTEYDRIYGVIDGFAAEFDAVLARPMPVYPWLAMPLPLANDVLFVWSPSFELVAGDGFTYELVVSTSDFSPGTVVAELTGLSDSTATIHGLPSGTYRWRVISRDTNDPSVNWQMPFYDASLTVP